MGQLAWKFVANFICEFGGYWSDLRSSVGYLNRPLSWFAAAPVYTVEHLKSCQDNSDVSVIRDDCERRSISGQAIDSCRYAFEKKLMTEWWSVTMLTGDRILVGRGKTSELQYRLLICDSLSSTGCLHFSYTLLNTD